MNSPSVNTTHGRVEGYEENGIVVFQGIPYAAPPVGKNRWFPPQPPQPWPGTKVATRLTAVAPQNEQLLPVTQQQNIPQSEDCLFLNIWTPGLDNARRPVLFWIHGGGFNLGSGLRIGPSTFSGQSFVRLGNCVVVTINHRLGLLGFLNLNEISRGEIPSTGNEGLLDQVAALQWVKDNITMFGGDPDNLTIFGESAGGMSCGCLLTMSKAKSLFHRAILQSGACSTANSLDKAQQIADIFLQLTGIKKGDFSALRMLTTRQIMQIQEVIVIKALQINPALGTMLLCPVIDGHILQELPLVSIRKGASTSIPVLVGSTLDEWKGFAIYDPEVNTLTMEQLARRLKWILPVNQIGDLVETYRQARKQSGQSTTLGDIYCAIQTDRVFRIPAIRLAEAKYKHSQPAYHYIYTWPSPVAKGILGSCHGIEVGFVWGTYDRDFCGEGEAADTMARTTQETWLAFANTGNPSCSTIGNWPVYGPLRETMMLGENSFIQCGPYENQRKAWDSISDETIGKL